MASQNSLSLNVRLAGMISVFALLIVAIVGVTYWVARAQEGDAVAVNLAGRQRMPSTIVDVLRASLERYRSRQPTRRE